MWFSKPDSVIGEGWRTGRAVWLLGPVELPARSGDPMDGGRARRESRAQFGRVAGKSRWGFGRRGPTRTVVRKLQMNGLHGHRGPIEIEVAAPKHFAGGKTVGGRWLAPESLAQSGFHGSGPGGSVIPARNARRPGGLLMSGAGFEVVGVEIGCGQAPAVAPPQRAQAAGTEVGRDLTGQGSGTALDSENQGRVSESVARCCG